MKHFALSIIKITKNPSQSARLCTVKNMNTICGTSHAKAAYMDSMHIVCACSCNDTSCTTPGMHKHRSYCQLTARPEPVGQGSSRRLRAAAASALAEQKPLPELCECTAAQHSQWHHAAAGSAAPRPCGPAGEAPRPPLCGSRPPLPAPGAHGLHLTHDKPSKVSTSGAEPAANEPM